MNIDSASQSPVIRPEMPRGDVYLGEMKLDPPSDDSGLKSKKWILAMFVESVASIFTVLGILTADQWLMVTGGIISLYFGVNFLQKKLIN
jgi:hypothetical protein